MCHVTYCNFVAVEFWFDWAKWGLTWDTGYVLSPLSPRISLPFRFFALYARKHGHFPYISQITLVGHHLEIIIEVQSIWICLMSHVDHLLCVIRLPSTLFKEVTMHHFIVHIPLTKPTNQHLYCMSGRVKNISLHHQKFSRARVLSGL